MLVATVRLIFASTLPSRPGSCDQARIGSWPHHRDTGRATPTTPRSGRASDRPLTIRKSRPEQRASRHQTNLDWNGSLWLTCQYCIDGSSDYFARAATMAATGASRWLR